MDRIENDISNNFSLPRERLYLAVNEAAIGGYMRPTILLFLRVFVAAVPFLPSRCLVTIGGLHIQTHRMMGRIYEVRR
jgi:hypothetical protein